jgi:hypothetical protein
MQTFQTLTKNLQVVQSNHTVRIQEEWMKKEKNLSDFLFKIDSIFTLYLFLIKTYYIKFYNLEIPILMNSG